MQELCWAQVLISEFEIVDGWVCKTNVNWSAWNVQM